MSFAKKKLWSLMLLITITAGMIFVFNIGAGQDVLAEEVEGKEVVTDFNAFAEIAKKVDAGVVKITTEIEAPEGSSPYYDDPFYKFFFDNFPQEKEPKMREGYGSGFIVSEDGFVVTNSHVIQNADKIKITINGFEESVPAEVVWNEYELDLAVVKVDVDKPLTPIELGDSSELRPGDWAIAIGNPFGFEHTVTVGVISALGRKIQIPTQNGQVRTYRNLMQTDAAINPGNSGGPLLNKDGEVIGINAAVSTMGQGIGFAIPINEIKEVINELKEKGEVKRPWLGISFAAVDEEIQEYFNLENTEGVLVMQVFEDSPADKAGLETYDVIVEVDKEPIKGLEDLSSIIKEKEIGGKIMIKIIRNSETQVVFAEIGQRPSELYE